VVRLQRPPAPEVGSEGYGRGLPYQAGTRTWDMSVFKNFPLGADSSRRLQLRFEFFNVLNHAGFSEINKGWSGTLRPTGPTTPPNNSSARAGAQHPGRRQPGDSRLGRALGEVNGCIPWLAGDPARGEDLFLTEYPPLPGSSTAFASEPRCADGVRPGSGPGCFAAKSG